MNNSEVVNKTKVIENFLRYLKLHGVSLKSLKYYKSDIVNFLTWAGDRKVSSNLIREYINSQRLTTPLSTLNRRLSTLRSYSNFTGSNFMSGVENVSSFRTISKSWQERIISKFINKPKLKNVLTSLFFNRPNWYRKYHSYPLASYIHIAILILFSSLSGYAVYDQVFYSTDRSLAFPTALERPNRFLSFQGRLTDDLGNPETVATNMVFKLYAVSTGGTELWDSGTCSITPDQDGIFSTLLGSSCGAEIASSVFSENADIWLGVTVGTDAEATPRIQIATVAYAINSETLQGFPAGTGTSTIPYIDSTGTVVLASASPKIQSTSGTFAVEGQALTLTTPNTSNGIITINPDGTGTLDLIFEGAAPGGGANGFVNATNANITSGSLYAGTIASNATGYYFINFLSGATPTSKFSVDSTGLTTIGADLYVTSGISTFGTPVSDGTIEATKFCTGDGETNCVTDFSSLGGGGGSSVWSDLLTPTANLSLAHAGYTTAFTFNSVTTADAFSLASSSLTTGTLFDLSSTSTAGGASGSSKILDITRSGTNANASHTAYGLYSNVTNTGTTSTNIGGYFSASGATNNYGLIVESGNVGIGTTTPGVMLDVNGVIRGTNFNTTTNSDVRIAVNAGSGSSGGTGNIFIGNGNNGFNNIGGQNTIIGDGAGYENVANGATLIGATAGEVNTGDYLTALGFAAGRVNSGDYSLFSGYYAGYYNTGNNVIALGYEAGSNNSKNNQFIVQQTNINAIPLIQGDFSTGNVGIGTITPGWKLDVAGGGSINNNLLTQMEGGLYYGRVGVQENQWKVESHGITWTARDSSRSWLSVAMSSDGKYQTAPVFGGQIYTSTNYGITWTARDSSRDWLGITISSDGKYQTAVAYSGQVYTSTDYGVTWTARDSSRSWRGVSMSSDGKYQTAVVEFGQVYTSTDYGVTWTARDSSRTWRKVSMSSDGKYQTAVVNSGQIYTSIDYGVTWTARDSSRNWAGVAMSSDGKYQTAGVDTGLIYTSSDYGATWTARDSSRRWAGVAMSSDGKYQTTSVISGQVYTSTDYGVTWTARDSSRSWREVAMSSDGKYQTAVVNSGQIYTSYANSTLYGGNVGIGTTGPDAKLDSLATTGEQLRLTYTDGSVYSGFTLDSNGYLLIDPTGARIALDGSLQVGSTSPVAYSRFGTATTGHGFTTSDDVLISGDLEVNGVLYLDGRIISNPDGTATIIFASDPSAIDSPNVLDNGVWWVNNTVNNGMASLMVNNDKGGDIFSASSSGTTKFTIHNDGAITLASDISSTTNTIEGTIFYDNNSAGSSSTDHLFLYGSDSAWHRIALDMTKYSQTNAAVANQNYIEIAHNQNTNDLSLTAWIKDKITGLWKTITNSTQTVKHALQNEFDDASAKTFLVDSQGTLINNLISFWTMNEASAGSSATTRNDSYGSNNLTDNNTTASGTGKVNNGADLESTNSEFFEITDNPSLSTGDIDFTISAWVNLESTGANRTIVSKSESSSVKEYELYYNNTSSRFEFILANSSGTTVCTATANNLGAPSTATWYFLTAWHDATADTCSIQANNGTVDSASETGVVSDTVANFRIGARYTTEELFFDGIIDEVGFWKKKLSAAEITDLYNSGNGNSYTTTGNLTRTQTKLTNIEITPAIDTGTGGDGNITVSGNTNINTTSLISGRSCADGGDAVNYSVTTLTATTATLSTTPASGCLAAGDEILLINLKGIVSAYDNVGNFETLRILSVSSNIITFKTSKLNYYGDIAGSDSNIGTTSGTNQLVMIQRVPNYNNVTVNASMNFTPSAFSGAKGGVMFFRATGTVSVAGNIHATGLGYAGGAGGPSPNRTNGSNGVGTNLNSIGSGNNNIGGGAGGVYNGGQGGGGGSYGTAGNTSTYGTLAGTTYGSTTLAKLYLGSGGGGGASYSDGTGSGSGGAGGTAGGIVTVSAENITVTGSIRANGNAGSNGVTHGTGGGGASGGSVKIMGKNLTLGSSLVSATGGSAGSGYAGSHGGAGGSGRIAIEYSSSISGTSSPASTSTLSGYNTYGLYHSKVISTPNASSLESIRWETPIVPYSKVSFQTRSGSTLSPTDGTWEAWKPFTATTNYLDLSDGNTHTEWTGTNLTVADGDVTRNVDQFEDEDEATAGNLTKFTSSTNGGYAEDTITSANLSGYDYLTFWIRASQTGSTVKVGMGESAGTEQEEFVKIDAADVWQKVYWDLSDIQSGARDAITKLRFTNLIASSNTIYIDNVRAEKLLTDHTFSKITSTPDSYLQYRVILSTTNNSYQPQVENVYLTYNDGYKIEQVDTNTVRLYNYTGEEQELRLDAVVFGADLAEWYTVDDDSIGAGDLVSITGKMDEFSVPILTKAKSINDPNLIGAISTKAGKTLGIEAENRRLLGLAGRIPVKIDPNSPAIFAGAELTSSQTPGLATLAMAGDRTIGKATENWEPNTGKDTITIIIDNSYAPNPTSMESRVYRYLYSTRELIDVVTERVVTQIGIFAGIITPEIKTNIISPIADSSLIIDLSASESARLVINGQDNQEVASIDSLGNANFEGTVESNQLAVNGDATISGTLYADDIESTRLSEIEELLREVETNQSLLAESQNWSTDTSFEDGTFTNLIAESIQANNLYVTGQAAISSLFVSDLLTVNKIESLDMPLQIQSLAATPLEIMAGKITVDIDGNTKFLGNVEVAGNLTINNIIVANNIDTTATESATIVEGEINSNATAGKAVLPANTRKVRINNNKVSLNTLIYITPIASTQNKVLYVKSKDTGYFEVGFSDTLETDVEFNWWIIELEGI